MEVPLLLVAGELDPKFVGIHRRMLAQFAPPPPPAAGATEGPAPVAGAGAPAAGAGAPRRPEHVLVELPSCGHALHVEAPLQLLAVLRRFLDSLEERKQ